jgi:WhiB family transcriptional regulator, redox-sensing transcriptional regulator
LSRIIPLPVTALDAGPGVVPAPALDSQRFFVVQEDANAGSTTWMVRGACRETDPELFFPIALEGSAVEEIAAARAICGRCEVRRQCLAYALRTMPHGIWGGTTREERIALRAAVRPGAPRALY